MSFKTTTISAIALSLAACACNRSTVPGAGPSPTSSTGTRSYKTNVRPGQLRMTPVTAAQVESYRWNRPGAWTPARLTGGDPRQSVALVTRDAQGQRMLLADPSAGYQILQVHIDCTHGGITVDAARRTTGDSMQADPKKPTPVGTPRMFARGEIDRICKKSPPIANGAPSTVAPILREANMRAIAPRIEPGAEQRAAMWKAYQAEHPRKPSAKP